MEFTIIKPRMIKKKTKKRKGFTLIEMVVVIAIIAIIASIATPQALRAVQKSKVTADIANARVIAGAISYGLAENDLVLEDEVWRKVSGISGIEGYLPSIPESKTVKDNIFYYFYDKSTSLIRIGIATKTSESNITEFYPTHQQ